MCPAAHPQRQPPCHRQRRRRGVVAVLFALMVVPIVLAVGGGIDYMRAVQARSQLQSAVDAAAIAGAAAYNGLSASAGGQTTAKGYMASIAASLPPVSNLVVTATPSTQTQSGTVSGYVMTVNATGTIPTTFLGLLEPTIAISASATALNPIVTITISLGGWNSSAWDANTVYWYVVPSGNGAPAASALHQLFTNTATAPATNPSFQVSATQQIGFALQNVTGGKQSYGNNQYGGTPGSVHMFYSHMNPPGSSAYPSVTRNCSLQVTATTGLNALPAVPMGSCFTTPFAQAAPSCSQINGKVYNYAWNDMGGSRDDFDYNDAVFNFTCGGGGGAGSGPTEVVLIK